MKQPLIFVQDPNALKNWLEACGSSAKILYDLHQLDKRFNVENSLVLIQVSEDATPEKIAQIASHNFDVLAFSNEPTNEEGFALFQKGVKGYLNTFSTPERIEQAMATILDGNVWLGQNIMAAMIKSVKPPVTYHQDWVRLLTDREFEVVKLVLECLPNRAIAERLQITERTVKAHLHNVFEKFAINDRLTLALKIKNWDATSNV
jgi:DNA-binding NarL/FixJ family response regulator